jgi:transketolase
MERKFLEDQAREIRKDTIHCIASIGVGHIGGSMSIVDALAVLYFDQMNIDPRQPLRADRDRFVLSKGHGGPALYATLARKGYFPREDLLTLNRSNTNLPSHADKNKTVGIDMTTGSLGQGFSAAVGMATAVKLDRSPFYIYAMIGDGESQEGQIWEAAMFAGNKKLDHLIAFTDLNKMQIDGEVKAVNDLDPIADKWKAFKWYVDVVDGHDVMAIRDAIIKAKTINDKPKMIILDTIKGKGADFAEGQVGSHNMPVTADMANQAIERLG